MTLHPVGTKQNRKIVFVIARHHSIQKLTEWPEKQKDLNLSIELFFKDIKSANIKPIENKKELP